MENSDFNLKKSGREVKSESKVCKISLDKSNSKGSDPTKLFVLPAGGMHVAVPDLNFHVNHFKQEPSIPSNAEFRGERMSKSVDSIFNDKTSNTNNSFQKTKLPFGLELTAGPGQKYKNSSESSKKVVPPSQTLFASAAAIKSYFNFSQDKESKDSGDKPKQETSGENDESMKNKVMGLWHNMKYGWSANLKTNFSKDTPIYLLGKAYHKAFTEEQRYEDTGFTCSNIEGFKKDFASLGWFTYRRKFPPLPESLLTTDCGWGCMIRSGQMMMLTALHRHFLPQEWKYSVDDNYEGRIHKKIMMMFCDDPSPKCPFSLHNLVLYGHKMNKKAGNWYGPSCVAHMFKDAIEEGSKQIPSLNRLAVYVAQDGAVYVQDVLDMCTVNHCLCSRSVNNFSKNSTNEESLGLKSCEPSLLNHCKGVNEDGNSSSISNYFLKEESDSLSCDSDFLELGTNLLEDCCSLESNLGSDGISIDYFVNSNRKTGMMNGKYSDEESVSMGLSEDSPSKTPKGLNPDPCLKCHGWKSCIIFIPVRLGGSSVNPIYHKCIYSLFLHDLCIGIIGGRPKHSLYFVGFQDESLIHLDPHLSQDAVPLNSEDYPLSTYHCFSPRKISVSKMDPSATIGFYCHTKIQFLRLLEEAPFIATAKDGNLESPIFEFVDGRSEDINSWLDHSLSQDDHPKLSISSSSPPVSATLRGSGPPSLENNSSGLEEGEELVFE